MDEGRLKFMRKADYPSAANGWNMGFCQLLIIKDGSVSSIGSKMKTEKNIYSALCEKDGKLFVVESKKNMTYELFVKCLSAYKVTTLSIWTWAEDGTMPSIVSLKANSGSAFLKASMLQVTNIEPTGLSFTNRISINMY